MAIYYQFMDYLLLALGLGFVIFFHELGHFLAAKYCGVKVEQFAVGFGPAAVAWRKGIGIRWGSTQKELAERTAGSAVEGALTAHDLELAPDDKFGDTEYRLNWIPLGGYVKMLGQDDLRPEDSADPRAYNNKPIRSRMLIVSAGVIMNLILAAIGFMIVFLIGYPVPPAVVGQLYSDSPAMMATRADGTRVGLQPGDQIRTMNGRKTIGDFTKVQLNVALAEAGEAIPIEVQHLDGKIETLYVTPARMRDDPHGLLALGITQPEQLAGPAKDEVTDWDTKLLKETADPDVLAVGPGDVITAINGQPVGIDEFYKLTDALQDANGQTVKLTVKSADGKLSEKIITPHFQVPFTKEEMNFLGMVPRASVDSVMESSPARGKLKPGDVVESIEAGSDRVMHPSLTQIQETLSAAGEKNLSVSMMVLSTGEMTPHRVDDLSPNQRIESGKRGLNISLRYDERRMVVARVLPGSAADGRIPAGATILTVNHQPVNNWFEVRKIIANSDGETPIVFGYLPPGENEKPTTASLKPDAAAIAYCQMLVAEADLDLRQMPGTMKTSNPLVAIGWGIIETRDLILEFYLTLQRMFTGGVSPTNMMGFVGMVHAGAQFASRGTSWLIWYLANISANLAVVNFLPIPIVDGGLFTLLILEKIQGKPLSQETQRIVQMVGLVLILGVFLLVTYQDIARIAGYAN